MAHRVGVRMRIVRSQADLCEYLRDVQASSLNEVAAKYDLVVLQSDLVAFKADIYRALWIQGAGLVAIQIALAGFIVKVL